MQHKFVSMNMKFYFLNPRRLVMYLKDYMRTLHSLWWMNYLQPPNKFNMAITKTFYDRMNISNNLKLKEVDSAYILKMLQRTNTNKATDIDKLPGIFIKGGAELLAAPLTQIIYSINYHLNFSRFL